MSESADLHVAVGVLENIRGEVLISQRKSDVYLGGAWEFPGGKLEAGETPLDALCRELSEELNIRVLYVRHLAFLQHKTSVQRVHLYCWKVLVWGGQLGAGEQQPLAWVPVNSVMDHGLLEADQPLVDRLLKPNPLNELPANKSVLSGVAG